MSWTEWLGALTGLACVWLVVREHVWNWPIGILNNAFFLVLFWQAGLFADSLLQVVYAGIAVWGWWAWLHGDRGGPLVVTRAPRTALGGTLIATAVATFLLGELLARFTPSTVPYMDALTTCLSLGATYLQGRKHLESWVLWITADVFYIGLYLHKDLLLTAAVYAVFLAMCFVGWRRWAAASAEGALA